MDAEVCVVGSCNMDLIAYVKRMPAVGETVYGHTFVTGFGGKGSNQAVMSAKLNATVAMIAKVGNDAYGRETIENFAKHGVNTSRLGTVHETSTGVAPITVDDSGNNSIVVIPGANTHMTVDDIRNPDSLRLIQSARVLVTQNEITPEATLEALKVASAAARGPITLYNPAPAVPTLSGEFLTIPDIVCLNETEAEAYTGVAVVDEIQGERACDVLLAKGTRSVILTMGAKGVLYKGYLAELESRRQGLPANSTGGLSGRPSPTPVVYFCPAVKVHVVDTSGAGDAFVGALAYYLARHKSVSLTDAIRRAALIASDSVTRKGTQSSYPTRSMLGSELFD